ncbi:flagellar hook assembly protein FlgD [Parasphingorhabdus halotolerans]|uniref:Basal-body rod modification protein FlgD n=1 Tax=Parasphingorhabdus halotolerans TaxID=2725558 RepID=A0A6H2DI44_9SPHN|nr:flagellar hook capping FlgD N-terminal domain-containing protein [Parasphingorhabdus halotolerans]QJB68004.1 flagellar hook capping protein [Parasphingorhabdus halotolerans]
MNIAPETFQKPVTNIAGLSQAQPENAKGDNSLDQDSFLRLMTTQLKFQDPFDPLDNQAMVAQLAQFSSVAGISEMKQSLSDIASILGNNRLSDAKEWIGHTVLVPGNISVAGANGQYAGEFELTKATDNLSIDLLNEAGEIVMFVELGQQEAGPVEFNFDSKDEAGKSLDQGRLRVRVNGGSVTNLATWVPVASVKTTEGNGPPILVTPIGNVFPAEALKIG